jgi:hypothetical protein
MDDAVIVYLAALPIHPPYRIGEGLFLEDEQLLIPWGTPLEQMELAGMPEVIERDEIRLFVWKNRRALGGLTGNLCAYRTSRRFGTTIYPAGLPTLHWFSMEVPPPEGEPEASERSAAAICRRLRESLKRIHNHLENCLGPASWSYAAYRLGLPSITWERLETTHGLFRYTCRPVGDHSVSITVAHWTSDYPELRAEAERAHADWARTDARVPFVAWDPDDPRIPQGLRSWRVSWAHHEIAELERRLGRTTRG